MDANEREFKNRLGVYSCAFAVGKNQRDQSKTESDVAGQRRYQRKALKLCYLCLPFGLSSGHFGELSRGRWSLLLKFCLCDLAV
jgi:hypothetical protein